jgi:competence protein ComEC
VGHGLAIVIQTPDDQTWLYDAGSLGDPRYTCDTISRFLWSRGIQRIDRLIVSHADADHYNAVPGVLQRFDVERVIVTPQMRQSSSMGLEPFWQQIESLGIPVEQLALGDVLASESGFQADILHPPRDVDYSSDNANSLVLRLEYHGHSLLLTGDLERDGLARFEQEVNMHCDVVLAPHHGSLHSHPLEFAEHCSASWIVVSGANALESGLVDRSKDAVLFDTARYGAVFVVVNDQGIHVDTFRDVDRGAELAKVSTGSIATELRTDGVIDHIKP